MNHLLFNEDLKCHWNSWIVISERHLVLDLPNHNVCDMGGAIKIAKFLCPDVERIDAYTGGSLGVQYLYVSDEQDWKALVPAKGERT